MSATRVGWAFTPATSRWLRGLVYLAVGSTAGPVLGLFALVAWTLVAEGSSDLLLVVLVVALFAGLGVGSGRALFALGGERRVHEDSRALSKRWLLGSVLVGAVGAVVAFRTTTIGFELVVVGLCVGLAALVGGAGLRSEGIVDKEEKTLSYAGHTIPLAAIRRRHSVALGPFVVVLLGYYRGEVASATPRVVVCSRAAEAAIESARRSTPAPRTSADERESKTAVRWVAAAFGVGCLLVGPLVWFVVPEAGRLVALYLGAFGLLFGGVFLRYAVVT